MKVSVVIPCYNVEQYIEECIDSVLKQNYKDIEIVCIDNNSSDKTFEKLVQLKASHPSLIIDSEPKPGANAARNKGLSLCTGQWIQFLDADDLLLPDKLTHQLKLIADDTSFVVAAYTKRDVSGNEKLNVPSNQNPFVSVFTNRAGITSSNLWNRQALLEIDGWNDDLKSSQEADLMMRLMLQSGKMVVDTQSKTIIRERESGQITQSNPVRKWKQYIAVRIEYLHKLKNQHSSIYDENIGLFQDFLMVSILTLAKHDFKAANDLYKNNIKQNWQSKGLYGMTKPKVVLIKIFGLRVVL